MAYDADLAVRIEAVLHGQADFSQRKMFGGIAFMRNGNMCVGVHKDHLIVRLDPESAESLLDQPGVEPANITGRPMKGWLMVAPGVLDDNAALTGWIERAASFVATLPPKKPKPK